MFCGFVFFFFFKQKTAYELRISDWSSDVCSSDLGWDDVDGPSPGQHRRPRPLQGPALDVRRDDDPVPPQPGQHGDEGSVAAAVAVVLVQMGADRKSVV